MYNQVKAQASPKLHAELTLHQRFTIENQHDCFLGISIIWRSYNLLYINSFLCLHGDHIDKHGCRDTPIVIINPVYIYSPRHSLSTGLALIGQITSGDCSVWMLTHQRSSSMVFSVLYSSLNYLILVLLPCVMFSICLYVI